MEQNKRPLGRIEKLKVLPHSVYFFFFTKITVKQRDSKDICAAEWQKNKNKKIERDAQVHTSLDTVIAATDVNIKSMQKEAHLLVAEWCLGLGAHSYTHTMQLHPFPWRSLLATLQEVRAHTCGGPLTLEVCTHIPAC